MAERRWPDDWGQRLGGKDCLICRALGQGDNDYWVHVTDRPFAEIHLERRTRLPGYCLVVWNLGHVAEPTQLREDEAAGYWGEGLAVGREVQAIYRPVKLKYMMLGNGIPHLHTHVVPRYYNDPAPGGPLPWDAMFSEAPVDDEDLHRQASELRVLL